MVQVPRPVRNTRAHATAEAISGLVHERLAAKRADKPKANVSKLKTPKSIRTRTRIVDAARELIEEHGAVDFQMSDVAERCNMSKGALYYYFKHRDEIADEVFNNAMDSLVHRLESSAAHAPNAESAMNAMCRSFAESLQEGGALMMALSSEFHAGSFQTIESRIERLCSLLSAQVVRAQGEGRVRKNLDARLVAHGICGAFLLSAIDYLNSNSSLTGAELTGQLSAFMSQGISCR